MREYKKHFGRIRKGRITKKEFHSWSLRAQRKRKEHEAGKITTEELESVWRSHETEQRRPGRFDPVCAVFDVPGTDTAGSSFKNWFVVGPETGTDQGVPMESVR